MEGEGNIIHAEAVFERHQKLTRRLPETLGRQAIITEMIPQNIIDEPETLIDLRVGAVFSILSSAHRVDLAQELHQECLGFVGSPEELQQFGWDFLQAEAPDLYQKAQASRTRYT